MRERAPKKRLEVFLVTAAPFARMGQDTRQDLRLELQNVMKRSEVVGSSRSGFAHEMGIVAVYG
jgi:hypothetical protein